MDSSHTAKSILKAHSSSNIAEASSNPASSRIRWDEDNLMMTEAAKGATMKITEPKTPYIHYNADTDTVLGTSANVAIPPIELTTAMQQYSDTVATTNNTKSPSVRSTSASSFASNGSEWDDSDDDEEADPEEQERRRKFKQMRAQHYNMKEALRKAKQVQDEADEEAANTPRPIADEDEEEEEEHQNGNNNHNDDEEEEEDDDDEEESPQHIRLSQPTSIPNISARNSISSNHNHHSNNNMDTTS
ncbi:hypothetical protein SmJEL517_g03430 [Synchytrium microbalum]|uniref:Protein phosphatase inhibitor 2 n=1 Tax=Synchytrium microbalum TaxID=1806994 RepID=A0A507C6Z4_9FUNG|nr:uncharacterized protein SmJEL517_g03430 [Synchytrium microbalum]TPX33766.1 hypothetical protein SmJEL517_g03430 [Synchytrium microbalum]